MPQVHCLREGTPQHNKRKNRFWKNCAIANAGCGPIQPLARRCTAVLRVLVQQVCPHYSVRSFTSGIGDTQAAVVSSLPPPYDGSCKVYATFVPGNGGVTSILTASRPAGLRPRIWRMVTAICAAHTPLLSGQSPSKGLVW